MTDINATTQARTARVTRTCYDDHTTIRPGDRYLRHVAFPGHEANGGTQPRVIAECVTCATRYGRDLDTGACLTYCHGLTPCPLPDRHPGDHSCPRCDLPGGAR